MGAFVPSTFAWAWVLRTPSRDSLFVALILAVIALHVAYARFISGRSWTLSFEDGRFRADFWQQKCDLPMSEILGFGVEPIRTRKERSHAAWIASVGSGGPAFDLCVNREKAEKIHVPLYRRSADEAQFVADRMNELLASGGRMEGGYRGEHVRVDVGRR